MDYYDTDDGWEVFTGSPHYTTNSEKDLHAFCNAAANGDVAKVNFIIRLFYFCQRY